MKTVAIVLVVIGVFAVVVLSIGFFIELARNQFDNNVIIDKYFDLYEEVLHN